MASELDLFFSLRSSVNLPFYLSGVVLMKPSRTAVLETPQQTYAIKVFSEPFVNDRKFFKFFIKNHATLVSLDTHSSFSNRSYKQRALSLSTFNLPFASLALYKRRYLIDYKDLKFPRRVRSFSFPRVGNLSFFLPKRLHRLMRNRLIGLRGSIYVFNFLKNFVFTQPFFTANFFQYVPLVLPLFILPFFTRRLRFFAFNLVSSVVVRFYLLKAPSVAPVFTLYTSYTRFVSLKKSTTIGVARFFFFILCGNKEFSTPSTYKFGKFLKQPRRQAIPPRFSPVLRSWG